MYNKLVRFFVLIALISTPVLAEETNKAENVKEEVPEIKKLPEEVGTETAKPHITSVSRVLEKEGDLTVEGIALNKTLLREIYSGHNFKTLYFSGNKTNDTYQKAIKFIGEADENGLSREYFKDKAVIARVANEEITDEEVAKTDLLITQLVAEMIVEIGNGQKIPEELQLQTFFKRPVRVENAAAAFNEFLKAEDPEKIITKYSPKNEQYPLLKKALKISITNVGEKRDHPKIDYNGDIKPGEKNRVIVDIRKKLVPNHSIFGSKTYDDELAGKVAELQATFNLKEDAVITKEFIDDLNAYDDEIIYRIKANMERYRWYPDKLEPTRLEVNLPAYRLYAYRDGKEDFNMGTIVGKDAHKTPIMYTTMYQFVLNPYWNVPRDYTLRNMVALLKQDPDYVKNQNFQLLSYGKDGAKEIQQSEVDWDKVTKENYHYQLRQLPGNLNVLGPIKFAINNPYDIYLHSTSEPWLFTNTTRGYSSGCIRVEDPKKLAKYVTEIGGAQIPESKFNELYNTYNSKDGRIMKQQPEKNDRAVKLNNPIPIYIVYFSVLANEDGTVEFTNDIYNLDLNMAKYLKY